VQRDAVNTVNQRSPLAGNVPARHPVLNNLARTRPAVLSEFCGNQRSPGSGGFRVPAFARSFSIPVMDESNGMTDSLIARNPCGAKMPCGDMPDFLAYAFGVGSRKTPVTGAERAIGARIREARERLGVSIAELGLATGSSRQKVQFWERGEHFPPLSDFRRICELLRTEPNHILGISPMRSLTDTDVLSARRQIQALAIAAKDSVVVHKRKQERLQRRSSATG